jgi:transposase InsO family protein
LDAERPFGRRGASEEWTLSALKRAFRAREFSKTEGPEIHHSDQGKQYAAWLDCLRTDMSRAGNPYENARMERFFKTLKTEEVSLYETPRQAHERIATLADARSYLRETCRIDYTSIPGV